MEGTSVLDQNKPAKTAPEAPAEPTSVLDQPQPAPAPATPTGEQSVLGGSAAGPKKPITFYKKAWFWIIIAVFVLGIAGLVVFLVIQANITDEAITKYNNTALAAQNAAYDYDTKFSTAYSNSSFYNYSRDSRYNSYHDKCLETLGISHDAYQSAKDIVYTNGEKAVEEYGVGKTRELADSYAKIVETLGSISDLPACSEMLTKDYKNSYKVVLGEFTVDDEESWYPDYGISVKVTNKNSKVKVSYVVELKAVDEDGDTIGTTRVYTEYIEPGKTGEETAFSSGYLSKIDILKTAKFSVVSVKEYNVSE